MTHISDEALLTSLGYKENMLEELAKIKANTANFEKVIKHVVGLNDNLKSLDALVAFSNSVNYIKFKSHSQNDELIKAFHKEIRKWADKYKADIERVGDKDTYYLKSVA